MNGAAPRRVDTLAVGLLLVSLPLGTAPLEVATGLTALLAAARTRSLGLRAAWSGAPPWVPFAGILALTHLLSALASGDLRAGLGQGWPLVPLVALPLLRPDPRVATAGVLAAVAAGGWGLAQALDHRVATAGFSHHLTLAYALLPPFGWAAAHGRWGACAVLAAGVLATTSVGAVVPLAATFVAARRTRPALAWLGGAAAFLLLLPAALPDELRQRAVLWTAGLELAATGPVGAGGYPEAVDVAQDRLVPGFHFPNHAHDSAIQVLATGGWPALLALVGLVTTGLIRGHPAGGAGLAGVALGALTQDTFGDLEVARAAWVWLAMAGTAPEPARWDSTRPEVPGC